MASAAVRRRPNCFNMVHQIRLMQALGQKTTVQAIQAGTIYVSDRSHPPQEWNNAHSVMQGLQIGKLEAGATVNLLNSVPAEIGDRLTAMVKMLCLCSVDVTL